MKSLFLVSMLFIISIISAVLLAFFKVLGFVFVALPLKILLLFFRKKSLIHQ
jgi:hypothetical protein